MRTGESFFIRAGPRESRMKHLMTFVQLVLSNLYSLVLDVNPVLYRTERNHCQKPTRQYNPFTNTISSFGIITPPYSFKESPVVNSYKSKSKQF